MVETDLDQPLFGWPWMFEDVQRIARLLEVALDDVWKMLGRDMSPYGNLGIAPFHCTLRFCRDCLQSGYHSIVFQHMAVAHCELHSQPLSRACPNCKSTIHPTLRSVFYFPYQCVHCHTPLASLKPSKNEVQAIRNQDASLVLWRLRLKGRFQRRELRTELEDVWPASASPAAMTRQLQRGLFVPEDTVAVWRYPEIRVTVLELGGPPALCGRIQLLKWFREHCPNASETRDFSYWHLQHMGSEAFGAVDKVSAVAVALHKTLNLNGLVWYFRDLERGWRGPLPDLWDIPRYTPPLKKWPALDERLWQLEIIGLMATLITSFRAGDAIEDVDWRAYPHPASYSPSWTLEPGERGLVTVVIRARATEASLLRLMQRFASASYSANLPRQSVRVA